MFFCKFLSSDDSTAFLTQTGLIENTDSTVTIPMSLINLARSLNGEVTQSLFDVHDFLVQIEDPSLITTPDCAVVATHGNSGLLISDSKKYWAVRTPNGLALFDEFPNHVIQVDVPVKLLGEITTGVTDILPSDYDWPRLRMISRSRPLASTFTLAQTNYVAKPNLVVMDSGINFDHVEFTGLETEDFYALPAFNGDFRDDAGHGTGVSSFACGNSIGVHSHLRLLNCKIFSATYKPNAIEIGQAIDAVYNRFIQNPTVPMVVNCSWAVAKNSYLEGKFKDLLSAGITVVCASGNSGANVDFLTPAGMINVITVAASDDADCGAGFNNFSEADHQITTNDGNRIDIFAPGVDVYGAHFSGAGMYCKYSGSSISSGFVAGAVAATMSIIENCYNETAFKLLLDYATSGVLLLDFDKFTMSQNKLVYLLTAENQLASDSMSYYLGALSNDSLTVTGDINVVLNASLFSETFGQKVTYEVIWGNEAPASELDPCITIDDTGGFIITNPPLTWDPDEKIRLISLKFKAIAESETITFMSPNVIFFASNPSVVSSLTGDIATALENIDNQSFFASWIEAQSIK